MTPEATLTSTDLFSLPPLQAQIRADAEALAARYAERHREVRRRGLEGDGPHPELWAEYSEMGWAGLLVPSDYGGADGGLLANVVVLETLAASNLGLWMPAISASIAHAIAEVGPDEARESWLGPMARGEAFLSLAVTEPNVGHNVFRSETTIRRDGDRFILDGLKAATSGIEFTERVLVLGRVPGERAPGTPALFTSVLIDPNAAGVKRTELQLGGRTGSRQWQLEFDGVEAPESALVGVEGQGLLTLWPFTQVERLLTAAFAVGGARYAVSRALERAGERTVFGKQPIGADQAIQHPLARLHARIEAVRLFVYAAAARFDTGADQLMVAGEANMAKVLATELAFDAADHAMQTLGASAWDDREGMVDLFLDARVSCSAPISNDLALNFVAQHVLGLPSH